MPKSRWAGGSARDVPPLLADRAGGLRIEAGDDAQQVVLPQPEGPRKQTNSPSATSSEMSPRAVKSPKRFWRLRTSR